MRYDFNLGQDVTLLELALTCNAYVTKRAIDRGEQQLQLRVNVGQKSSEYPLCRYFYFIRIADNLKIADVQIFSSHVGQRRRARRIQNSLVGKETG
jgi:hypothetical protein